MQKIAIIGLALIISLSGLTGCVRAEEEESAEQEFLSADEQISASVLRYPTTEDGEFRYSLYDTCAVITQYIGDDKNVVIPDEFCGVPVIKIKKNTFAGTNITSVKMGRNLLCIGQNAFAGCTQLETVSMSGAITTIESGAFKGCTSLKSIIFPSGIGEISSSVCSGCSNLTKVIIESGAEGRSIKSNAFAGCSSLASIWIPSDITGIATNAVPAYSSLAIYGAEKTEAARYAADNLIDYVVTTREGFDTIARSYKPSASVATGLGVGDTDKGEIFSIHLSDVKFYTQIGNKVAGDNKVFAVFIFDIENTKPVSRWFDGFNIEISSYAFGEDGNLYSYSKEPFYPRSATIGYEYPVCEIPAYSSVTKAVCVEVDSGFKAIEMSICKSQRFVVSGGVSFEK